MKFLFLFILVFSVHNFYGQVDEFKKERAFKNDKSIKLLEGDFFLLDRHFSHKLNLNRGVFVFNQNLYDCFGGVDSTVLAGKYQ